MSELTGFVAYPNVPGAIGETIRRAVTQLRERSGQQGLSSWEETDVAGNFIRSGFLAGLRLESTQADRMQPEALCNLYILDRQCPSASCVMITRSVPRSSQA